MDAEQAPVQRGAARAVDSAAAGTPGRVQDVPAGAEGSAGAGSAVAAEQVGSVVAAADGVSSEGRSRLSGRGRRRQANIAGGRPFTHLVKVSEAEEAVLLRLSHAAKLSVPRLLVESTLASDGPMRADQAREVLTTLFGVQRLLGSIAWNVNQVATAVNSTHDLPEQTATVFDAVLRVTQRIDLMLEELPTASQIKASEHTRRRRRVAAVFGEAAAQRVSEPGHGLGGEAASSGGTAS